MLSVQQLLASAPRRRSLRSLRQQYDLYIMDRIENHKNSLSRDELLRLADEAMVEMRDDEQQFLLTEMVAATAVDDLIKRRLGIKSYGTWRKQHPKLREAQRNPIHWNLDPGHLVVALSPQIEPDDPILVIGSGAENSAYLLAAHEAVVTYLDRDFNSIERAELRVVSEALSSTFDAYCVQFGQWLPPFPGLFSLVVIDSGTLASLAPGDRRALLAAVQEVTAPGGLHALVPDIHGSGPEGFAGHYSSWRREQLPPSGRRPRSAPSRGALFAKPAVGVMAADSISRDASA